MMSNKEQLTNHINNHISRRGMLRMVAGTSAAGAAALTIGSCAAGEGHLRPAATKGRLNVIAFTGYREDIPDDVGAKNCVTGLKKIIGHAERKKVNLCMEILNSRVDVEMKGHPGYQGDHTDYCMDIIKQVGSPNMKLLFDIYHVQVMDGDIISRIRQYKDYIGHYHTAGNPGRGELDDKQEINYPQIMREIVKTGYHGYVGHEFVPTRNPFKSLAEAVTLCDV
jgi:hydroxypyruvate isomerase